MSNHLEEVKKPDSGNVLQNPIETIKENSKEQFHGDDNKMHTFKPLNFLRDPNNKIPDADGRDLNFSFNPELVEERKVCSD